MYGRVVGLLCLGGGGTLKWRSRIADGNDLNNSNAKVMKHLSPSSAIVQGSEHTLE